MNVVLRFAYENVICKIVFLSFIFLFSVFSLNIYKLEYSRMKMYTQIRSLIYFMISVETIFENYFFFSQETPGQLFLNF